MRCLALLSIFLILAGCKHSVEKDHPQGLVKDSIIPQSEMVNILIDIHVLEAALQLQRNKNSDPVVIQDFYYDKLFSKYKVSSRKFKLNLQYYESDPDNFRKMYDQVVKRLEAVAKMPVHQ